MKTIHSASCAFTLGMAERRSIEVVVDKSFRVKRLLTNAPREGMFNIHTALIGREAVVYTTIDAFMMSQRKHLVDPKVEQAVTAWDEEGGIQVEAPLLERGAIIRVDVEYAGFAPSPFYNGQYFLFVTSALGIAVEGR